MNYQTKKTLSVSIILLLLSLGAVTYLTLQIRSAGTKLAEYNTALSERNTKEAAFIRVNRLVQETEEERSAISDAFFADEGTSIAFLGNLETFAANVGVTLKTDGLDKIVSVETKREFITMTFVYSGNREKVKTFTRLLEEVPYHSSVSDLSLKKQSDDQWVGRLTLLISILPS